MQNKYLITIVGPTAIGKTALSIQLAKYLNTEIISADSRQFFREMKIGTAVPSEAELAAAPHHFIQHKSVEEAYSVGDFERDALEKLKQLFQTHQAVIAVGGSGLYIKALTEGLDYFPEVTPGIREKLNLQFKKEGIRNLQKQLEILDPEYYKEVDKENPHRIIRALEICIATGKPFSSFKNKKPKIRAFQNILIGLTADRKILYDRINKRVNLMMKDGLLEETRKLYPKHELNALNTVGYKELFAFLNDDCTLEEAVEEIKKNTRRFAKRQLTWFRKDDRIHWFDYKTPAENIITLLQEKMKN